MNTRLGRCGQGDAALAAGRPLLGCPGLGRASFADCADHFKDH